MRWRLRLGWYLFRVCPVLASVLFAGQAYAQISPGELTEAHADLDGSGTCLECHQARKGVAAELCLSCHKLLAERITAGLGLHATEDYEQCESCHIEHSGREFELVWWGEGGVDSFDHRQAGYTLEGAHSKLECGKCHNAELISDPERLEKHGKDLSRTFLGLETQCLACHEDYHRGQVAADDCTTCHNLEAWKPPSRFDHGQTEFPLTGRHRDAQCSKCHATLVDQEVPEPASYLQFKVAAFKDCTDCHTDPHEGRLGASCTECHATTGWTKVNRSGFDHQQTRFPLLGKHGGVECRSCHPPGRSSKVDRFEVCTDCHSDSHFGQFDRRDPGGSACEGCHTVEGFSPSTFTVELHQLSEYPLTGSHLAVPCFECHLPIETVQLAGASSGASLPGTIRSAPKPVETARYRFESTGCMSCHTDPHLGEVDRFVTDRGCVSCHAVESWRLIEFDHNLTNYRLEAKHAEASCEKCHKTVETEEGSGRIRMVGAPRECGGCHLDPHMSQFTRLDGTTDCASCHVIEGWNQTTFDHNRDSVYPLEGAHLRVSCAECHPTELSGDQVFARYKPLPTDCESCHGPVPIVLD